MTTDAIMTSFLGLIGFVITWGVFILKDLSKSVSQLNVQMATIVEKTASHEKQIDRMDSRLIRLEDLTQ